MPTANGLDSGSYTDRGQDVARKEEVWAKLHDSFARRLQNVARMPLRLLCRGSARLRRRRTVVLAYHSVGDGRDAVGEREFQKQMKFLHENAQVVDLEAIVRGDHLKTEARLTCAITFDDGYANVHKIAGPLLYAYKFPAKVYLTVGAIDPEKSRSAAEFKGLFQDETMLTWKQVIELYRIGFTFGSHLCQHHDMTQLEESKLAWELEQSKTIITERLGVECRHFAYPFGYFDRQCVQLVSRAGYESAVTVMHRNVPNACDPLRIPRMCIAPFHTLADFGRMLGGDFDYLPIIQRTRRVLRLDYQE